MVVQPCARRATSVERKDTQALALSNAMKNLGRFFGRQQVESDASHLPKPAVPATLSTSPRRSCTRSNDDRVSLILVTLARFWRRRRKFSHKIRTPCSPAAEAAHHTIHELHAARRLRRIHRV